MLQKEPLHLHIQHKVGIFGKTTWHWGVFCLLQVRDLAIGIGGGGGGGKLVAGTLLKNVCWVTEVVTKGDSSWQEQLNQLPESSYPSKQAALSGGCPLAPWNPVRQSMMTHAAALLDPSPQAKSLEPADAWAGVENPHEPEICIKT